MTPLEIQFNLKKKSIICFSKILSLLISIKRAYVNGKIQEMSRANRIVRFCSKWFVRFFCSSRETYFENRR